MRVCHLVSGDGWGGAETVVAGLIEGQCRHGDLGVSVIALNEGRLADVARGAGVTVEVVPEARRTFPALARDVRRALLRLSPDVVHTHRYKENLLSFLLARGVGARSVVTIHGYEPPIGLGRRTLVAARDTVTFRLGRAVGARFAAVSDDLAVRYGVEDVCVTVRNGVRTVSGRSRAEAGCAGLPPSAAVVGWIGRMVEVKDLPLLLRAFALLAGEPWLLLVGDGPERPAVERMAGELGVASRVLCTGFVENPGRWLARMDAFVLCSKHEGLPMALLEALDGGIPVVAAAVGGIPEALAESDAARLVADRDPVAWARAIEEALRREKTTRARVERGRALVQDRFSVEAMTYRYDALYRLACRRT